MSDPGQPEPQSLPLSAVAVFLLSAAVIALELALMRCLSVARWHHFSYLVVSTALLGFGASGTLLTFVGERMKRRFGAWTCVLTLLFALSVPLVFRVAESLPLDVQYVLYSARQAGLLFAHDFLLTVPFTIGATAIGLSLMQFRERLHLVYGANLGGSGAGAVLATALMFVLPPEQLLHAVSALGLAAGLCWALAARAGRGRALAAVCTTGLALACLGLSAPVRLRIDPYKFLATLQRWEAEGNARRLLTRNGPRARLDVYESSLLHQTMFAGLTATEPPPAQLAILADGHPAATVLEVRSGDEAAILDHTPMSLPYRLSDRPRVLLLGEAGGTNVWLARRMGAAHVTVVHPNPQLLALVRGPLAGRSGGVLLGADVTVVCSGLRAFLERTEDRFDVIHVASAEEMAAAGGGLRSLHEDFLLTREGLALCLAHLTDRGVLALTRGVQAPPRDNVKLFATLRAALGPVEEPGSRLAQARGYLAATNMAFAQTPDEERCERLRAAVDRLRLDIEWAPCEGIAYGRQINRVEGPPGQPHSYFHHAALRILSPERERFLRTWAYQVRPATDDSPYFYNFFRWRTLPRFWQAYGRQWLQRLELGYVVLIFALVQVLIVGAALILLPLLRLRSGRGASGGRLPTLAYFTLLGLGFMLIEMVCLLKFTRFLGDPIYAAAGMLSSFLVFSGLGSAASRRLCPSRARAIRTAGIGVATLALAGTYGLGPLFGALAAWPLAARLAASVAVTAPAAFLMGWPFPNGLAIVERDRPRLVPWAWGVNGFASVAASPLAVLIAIHAGFRAVLVLAAVLYVLAAAVSSRLPRRAPS